MNKKIVLILPIALVVVVVLALFLNRPKNQLSNPLSTQTKEIVPSETFIEYSDPSGFTFSYPDNLSITKNEIDDSTYADIQLSSNQVNGSLNLKISDTKLTSINEWVKMNQNAAQGAPKEVKLGNLKALEVKLNDRLLLGALDQGVLFTIEIPAIEEDFWMKVYNKILAEFSFVAPQQESASSQGNTTFSSDEVIFEGEEAIE